MNRTSIVFLLLACLAVGGLAQTCKACAQCKDCSPAVLSDPYLDDINALLQKKIDDLGYPVHIDKVVSENNSTYTIQYSSGLIIQLTLHLDSMQIQLLNYSFQGQNNSSQLPASLQGKSYSKGSDGYYLISDFASNTEIVSMTRFLSQVVKTSMSYFKLVSASYTTSPAVIFKLSYQIVTFSAPFFEDIYIQYLGANSYKIIDSNYSQIKVDKVVFRKVDPLAILNDVWLPMVNSLIIAQYSNLLGAKPMILTIQQQEPSYRIVYQVQETNYSFFIIYDYVMNRIIQGNITITSSSTTEGQTATSNSASSSSSQTTNNIGNNLSQQSTPNQQQSISNQQQSSSSQQSFNSTTSTGYTSSSSGVASRGSTNSGPASFLTQPTVQPTVSQQSSSVVQQSSTVASQSSKKTSSSVSPPQQSQLIAAKPAQLVSVQSQTSTTSSQSAKTAQSSSSYTQIQNFSSSPAVISVVSYLSSLDISLPVSQIRSVKILPQLPLTYYQLIAQPAVPSSKTIFYQFTIEFNSQAGKYSLLNSSYLNLDLPSYVLLNMQDITMDAAIRSIARYLLQQKYSMLGNDSRIVRIQRDFPFYRFVFRNQAANGVYVSVDVLFQKYLGGEEGGVKVLSITSSEPDKANQTTGKVETSNSAATIQKSSSAKVDQSVQNSGQSVIQTTSQQQSASNGVSGVGQLVQVPRVNSSSSQTVQQTQASQQTQIGQVQSQQVQVNIKGNENQNTQPSDQLNLVKVPQVQTNNAATQANSVISGLVPATKIVNNAQASTINQSKEASTPSSQVLIKDTTQSESKSISINNGQLTAAKKVQIQTKSQPQTSPVQPVVQNTTVLGKNQSSKQTVSGNQQQSTTTSSQQSTTTSSQQSTTSSQQSTTSSSAAAASSNASSTLVGYTRLTNDNKQYYPYVLESMAKVNDTFLSMGYTLADILYTDILIKFESSVLYIVIRVLVSGKTYAFQYQRVLQQNASTTDSSVSTTSASSKTQIKSNVAPVPSATAQNKTATPVANNPSGQTTTATSIMTSSTITYNGVSFNRIPQQMAQQAYINLFVKYLEATQGPFYSQNNLAGIFTNIMVPYSLLFVYIYQQQLSYINTNASEVQQKLVEYYKQQGVKQQGKAITNELPKTTTTTSGSVSSSETKSQTNQSANAVNKQTTASNTQGNIAVGLSAIITSGQSNTEKQTQQISQTTQSQSQAAQSQFQTVQSQSQTAQSQSQTSQSQATQTQQSILNVQPSSSGVIYQQQNVPTQQSNTVQQQSTAQKPAVNVSSTISSTQSSVISSTSSGSSGVSGPRASPSAPTNIDPNCLCYDKSKCMRCAHRYYLNNNQCMSIPLECLSYDIVTGACYSCVPGYQLISGLCEPSPPTAYYFQNQCVTCFGNYKMVNKRCVYSPPYQPNSPNYIRQKNILCFGWEGMKCVECIPGAFLSKRGVCELIDPFCSLFDYIREVCDTCEDGYSMRDGRCFKISV